MADVAREAGVSISTVSHVLNGTRRVMPETEAAVRAAIENTGYIQDTVARSLARGGTMTVGVAMSAISNPFFGEVLKAIERRLATAGYSLALVDTHDDGTGEHRAVESLLGRRVDAMVLAPSGEPARSLSLIARAAIPVVVIDRVVKLPVDQVAVQNVEPTAQLVDHLVGHGHRRIAMISGRPGITTTDERVAGYKRGLRRNGLEFDPDLLRSGDGNDERAEEAMRRLLEATPPPTAVITGNNLMTIGAMRHLRAAGLDVPHDLALVAFDDFIWADLFHPRLTTIAQPTTQLGERAAQLLLDRIAQPDRRPERVRLRPRLVVRESCGCAPSPAG
jgi:LacI family transcriptional regulator